MLESAINWAIINQSLNYWMEVADRFDSTVHHMPMPYSFSERCWALDHKTVFGIAPLTLERE